MKHFISVLILVLAIPFGINANISLDKAYRGNDGSAIYMRQVNNSVFFFAEHPGKNYAFVFRGKWDGAQTVKGEYWGVPKFNSKATGKLEFKIYNKGKKIGRIKKTGAFPITGMDQILMKKIISVLPNKRKAAFKSTSIRNLDGVWDADDGARYYVNQVGSSVIWFGEKSFKKGKRPAFANVFIGKRSGNVVKGQFIDVVKGKMKGKGSLTLRVSKAGLMQKTAGNTIARKWERDIPSRANPNRQVRIPIADIRPFVRGYLGEFNIRLNNMGDRRGSRKNGYSWHKNKDCTINLRNRQLSNFDLPSYELRTKRGKRKLLYYIRDMKSRGSIVETSGRKFISTILFEEDGKEIGQKYNKQIGKDRLQDGHIDDPEVDIELELVNSGNAISYKVNKVNFTGRIDMKGVANLFDGLINKKARPAINAAVKASLNDSNAKAMFRNTIQAQIRTVNRFVSAVGQFGINPSSVTIKSIQVQGNDIVINF